MTRPQARMAFIPISNRQRPAERGAAVPHLGDEVKDSWYSISAKKKGSETVAEIYIYDEIGFWGVTATDFVKELTTLDATQINLHINSPGGDVFDGVAIYNALRMHSANVKVTVDSLAASAASFIAQAGDELVMLRNSTMMIHDASAIAWGNEKEMRDTADLLGRISDNIADIYAQRAGGTVQEWRDIMKAEMWYSADEAVEAGLADSVLDLADEDAAQATNAWDLHVYNFAGRDDAPDPLARTIEIKNKAKEATVGVKKGSPQNSDTPEEEETTAPEGDETSEDVEETDDVEETEDEETEEPTARATPAVSNKGGVSFVINGVATSDPAAVQAHINMMETANKEAKQANRRSFVQNLAEGDVPKIFASQISQLEELVDTFSDEQFEKWSASWDAAPPVGAVQRQGVQDGGQQPAQKVEQDELATAKDIVKQHKMGNMPIDKIKNTDSYRKVIAAEPDFQL